MSTAPALHQLQRQLQTLILSYEGEISGIDSDAAADAPTRVGIYADAYRLRLLEVLENDFIGLRALAGEENFTRACSEYIEAQPSHHFNARWYGARFATFLRDTAPWSDQLELCAMVDFEWALTLAFDAADQPHATVAEMAALPAEQWADMRPMLLDACLRRTLAWNVVDHRRAAERNEEAPQLVACEPCQELLIWRRDNVVRYRRLEADEAAALDALRQGACFAELCELLCEWHEADAVAIRAAQMLRRWIVDQCLAPLTHNRRSP